MSVPAPREVPERVLVPRLSVSWSVPALMAVPALDLFDGLDGNNNRGSPLWWEMKTWQVFASVAVLAAGHTGRAQTADVQRIESGPVRVSLIELYTSEGCSSCPPAEKWLGTLRDEAGLWKTFVPVAFHVDYWDRLGWPDRFASREATQREYAYANHWGSHNVYTPCFVRDGAEWRTRGEKIMASPGTPGNLVATYDGSVLRAEFSPKAAAMGESYEVHAALLGGGIVSKVTAGENRGETLAHEFVSLALAHGGLGAEIPLPRKAIAGVTRHALAVWVTRRGEIVPLQAAGGWLR